MLHPAAAAARALLLQAPSDPAVQEAQEVQAVAQAADQGHLVLLAA